MGAPAPLRPMCGSGGRVVSYVCIRSVCGIKLLIEKQGARPIPPVEKRPGSFRADETYWAPPRSFR